MTFTRRQALQCALLAAVGCGNDDMRPSLGIPFRGTGYVTASAIALGAAWWASGGYWDLRQLLTGEVGSTQTSGLTSQTSAAVLSPAGAPIISGDRIGGRRCLAFDGLAQYLRCDALATLLNGSDKPWTIALRYRSTASGTQALISAGSSAGSTDNFWQVRTSTLQRVEVRKDASGEATITRTGTIDQAFDDHVLVISSNGTTISAWLDRVLDTFDSSSLDTLSVVLDRFVVGAFLSSSAGQYFQGFIQAFAISSNVAVEADALAIDTSWRAGDFIQQDAVALKAMECGDSLTKGDSGNDGGGARDHMGDYVDCNGLSVDFVGQYAQGQFPDREHSAQGGNTMSTIASRAVSEINARGGVDIIQVMMGTNNMDDQSAAVSADEWSTRAASIVAANNTFKPAALYIFATIPKIFSPNPGGAEVEPFNAELPTRMATLAAAYPSATFLLWDAYSVTTDAGDFVDGVHPNTGGYAKWGLAWQQQIGPAFIARSPTRFPLTVNLLSPVGGATLTQGVQVTLTGVVSRTTATVIVKDDQGDTLGTATVAIPDGDQPNTTWSLNYTPGAGDVGSRTLHAEATDAIGGATGSSSNVTVTVEAPSATYSDFGTLLVFLDGRDPTSKTIVSGDVVAWANKAPSGVGLSESTKPPSVATAWCNGHDGVSFDKGNTEQLIGGADSAIGTALNHTAGAPNKSYTRIRLVEFQSTNDVGHAGGFANSASSNQGIYFGQRTTSKLREFRQDAATNVQDPTTLPATTAGKWIVATRYDGATGIGKISVTGLTGAMGAETSWTSTLAGALTVNRYCLGCRGDPVTDSHLGQTLGDVVEYAGVLDDTNIAAAIALMQSRWA